MRTYFMIAIGGFCGAILRFLVAAMNFTAYSSSFPLNTLIVNVAGSFAIGLIITISEEILKLGEEERIGVVVGFLGAFTTFSTISREISQQLSSGYYLLAVSYIILTVVLGLGSVFFGIYIGNRLLKRKDMQTEGEQQ
jgi:CrcB protein